MIDPRTPILVGCGQITDTTSKPSSERSNVAFCAEAAGLALADTSAAIGAADLGRKIDAVAVLEFFPDISPRFASPFGRCSNPPRAVANRLAAAPRQLFYAHSGATCPSTWSTASAALASVVSYKIHSPIWSNYDRRRRSPSGSAVFVIGKREPVFRFAWIGWRSDLLATRD